MRKFEPSDLVSAITEIQHTAFAVQVFGGVVDDPVDLQMALNSDEPKRFVKPEPQVGRQYKLLEYVPQLDKQKNLFFLVGMEIRPSNGGAWNLSVTIMTDLESYEIVQELDHGAPRQTTWINNAVYKKLNCANSMRLASVIIQENHMPLTMADSRAIARKIREQHGDF